MTGPATLSATVKEAGALAPHDLRRTCARLCYLAGGELDQIRFVLGHVSIQTTERYLGYNSDCDARSTTVSESSRRPLELRARAGAKRPPLATTQK
jgi:integrase